MRRVSRLILAAAFVCALALATGCAAFDSWYNDGIHSTEYPREAPPPPPKELPSTAPTPSNTAAGIYTEPESK